MKKISTKNSRPDPQALINERALARAVVDNIIATTGGPPARQTSAWHSMAATIAATALFTIIAGALYRYATS